MKKPDPIVRAETEDGQLAGEMLIDAVETQIRDESPPESKLTLERLMSLGETRSDAVRLIAFVLSIEVFETLTSNQPYDEARYIRNPKALPDLPNDAGEI